MPTPNQRLYIDESGDHSVARVTPANWDKRYLCLFGCSIPFDYCLSEFAQNLQRLKDSHFPTELDDAVILHREDISAKSGHFSCLRNSEKKRAYQEAMLHFVENCKFRAFSVVIDKLTSCNRNYGLGDTNPYHISLAVMLERYCGWLRFSRQMGDVLAESRGGREDKQLKAAYQAVLAGGTSFRGPDFFSSALTSEHIKIKPKSANIPGLQLADQLAYASKRRILEIEGRAKPLTGFEKELADILQKKYNHQAYDGRVKGYGTIFLS